MNAYDWGSASDNEALIYEEVHAVFSRLQGDFPRLRFSFEGLGGKAGSIYCDICAQIRCADVVIFNLSTNNPNVIFELGLAVGFGTHVFVLRSTHYQRRKGVSDLNGILEHRFSRRGGGMKFQADFPRSLERTLRHVAQERLEQLAQAGA
jgi:nucleoside 2-deoxyribosyltransferase